MILAGFLIGGACGAALVFRQPKQYLGLAMIESREHQGHAERLTPLREKMVARDLNLEKRWKIPFESAAAMVGKCTRLKSSKEGVRIEVRYFDPRDARIIAAKVGTGLEPPARELEMASKHSQVKPFPFGEMQLLEDTLQLEWLLDQEAQDASYPGCYAVVELAAAGDPKAVALTTGEDFSRRWSMFKELSERIGYLNPRGEPFRAPNTQVMVADINTSPVSPIVAWWLHGGAWSGAALGCVLALCLHRWKPGVFPADPPPGQSSPVPSAVRAEPQEDRPATREDPW